MEPLCLQEQRNQVLESIYLDMQDGLYPLSVNTKIWELVSFGPLARGPVYVPKTTQSHAEARIVSEIGLFGFSSFLSSLPHSHWLLLEHFLCTPLAQECSLQCLLLKEPNLRQYHYVVCFQEYPASSAFQKLCAMNWVTEPWLSCCCCCWFVYLFCFAYAEQVGTQLFQTWGLPINQQGKVVCVKWLIIMTWVKHCK